MFKEKMFNKIKEHKLSKANVIMYFVLLIKKYNHDFYLQYNNNLG